MSTIPSEHPLDVTPELLTIAEAALFLRIWASMVRKAHSRGALAVRADRRPHAVPTRGSDELRRRACRTTATEAMKDRRWDAPLRWVRLG
jgi:hypothetical protein